MSNVIAIDGPAASGKSTAARLLAERLNIAYVNTGSLYRAVALAARRAGQEMGALSPEFLNTLKLEYVPDQNGRYELKLDGSFPGAELRSAETASGASLVATQPAVRDYLGVLSGGCSKTPIDLLRGAGVDMTTPQPVESALKLFGELLDEMEALLP